MPKSLRLKSFAKINLSLEVGDRQPDGYHLIESVMQSVDLADEVTVSLDETGLSTTSPFDDVDLDRRKMAKRRGSVMEVVVPVRIQCNHPHIPTDSKNTAAKAAHAFFARAGERGVNPAALVITLRKRVPIAAGLAGGSGNGAAVLIALNEIFEAGYSLPELQEIGMNVGSDVPFCLQGGTAHVGGKGEKVEALPPAKAAWFVLVKPAISVSTAEAYAEIDKSREGKKSGKSKTENFNRFEEVILPKHPEVGAAKKALESAGASAALMTGSGPTVFGIFASESAGESALETVRNQFPECYLVSPVPHGVTIL